MLTDISFMKNYSLLLSVLFLLTAACSSGPKSDYLLNCEKLHEDSQSKLIELQRIFSTYQEVNYDLTAKLIPPLRTEVVELDHRVKQQKQRCWPNEDRVVDEELAVLKEQVTKLYGELPEPAPKKVVKKYRRPKRVPASVEPQANQQNFNQERGDKPFNPYRQPESNETLPN